MKLFKFLFTSQGRLSKYTALLVAIIAFLVAQPIFYLLDFSAHLAHGLLCLIMLAATVSTGNRRTTRFIGWGLILPAVIFTWSAHAEAPPWLISISYSLNIAILLAAIANLLHDIYRDNCVNVQAIVGAINVYLLIGLAFALFYDWISLLNHGAIHGLHDVGSVDAHLSHSVYFSFVTLSTLGYGDILPVTPLARTATWVEAVTGQLFLATLIAGLVGKMVADRARTE